MSVEQGYPVQRFLDSNNIEVLTTPSYGGAPGPNAKAQPQFTERVLISNAQLLALKTTPIQLTNVAPILIPPADMANTTWIIVPDTIALHYYYATAAFTLNAGTLKLFYGAPANGNALCADQSAILTNTTNEVNPWIAVTAPGTLTEANGLQQNIYLGNVGTANFTAGGGTLVVAVTFSILTM